MPASTAVSTSAASYFALRIDGLHWLGRVAVDNASLAVALRQVFGFLCRCGAGRSAMIRAGR